MVEITNETRVLWLERRLKWMTTGTLPLYIRSFKSDWFEANGTLDNIPQYIKDKVNAKWKELKAKEDKDAYTEDMGGVETVVTTHKVSIKEESR